MKEKIMLAPGAGGSELLRMLAKSGTGTIGMRVMSSVELSKHALMKSAVAVTEEFLTRKEEPSVFFSFLKEIPYFENASYADAENLAASMYTLRGLIKENENDAVREGLANGEFADKNDALLLAYEKYMDACRTEGRIDSIGLMRKAADECDSSSVADAEYYSIREYQLTPLEQHLLDTLSAGKAEEISVAEFLGKGEQTACEEKTPEITYVEGYGRINEIEHIISGIYRSKLPLDDCIIACTDTSEYAQVIYDIAMLHNMPVTFGSGVPIANAESARLLKLIYEWDTEGFNGTDALKRILTGDSFSRTAFSEKQGLEEKISRTEMGKIAEMAGNLRISFEAEENRKKIDNFRRSLGTGAAIDAEDGRNDTAEAGRASHTLSRVETLADAFREGIISFIRTYSVIRPEPYGRIDQSALNVITESLSAYEAHSSEGSVNEIIPQLLSKTVCSENSREGCLHVTSITGAMSAMRKNLFVCGLGAGEFPGSPSENYLLLDKDLTAFADEENTPSSQNRIRDKKEALRNLLKVAAASDAKVSLSYSGFDLAQLKEQNPSSVLFEIYAKQNPGKGMDDFAETLRHAEYFESGLNSSEAIGRKYASGEEFEGRASYSEMKESAGATDRAWSPSALEVFFQCPRRFYLTRICGLPETEENDPFEVLDAGAIGTLAHSLMEDLAASQMGRAEFRAKAEDAFEIALAARPPMHESDALALKEDFLKMMGKAFDMDPHNEVLSAEREYSYTHPTGIKLHGYPDRVEKDTDGNHIIADFKTKRRIDHIQNDIDTCLQVVIYAWLCEQAGTDITRCEYRYMRKEAVVPCEYNDAMKEALSRKLTEFREALETESFPRNPGAKNENCRYCRMADICIWPGEGEEE